MHDPDEAAEVWLRDILSRPWDCSTLDMELKTAIGLKDLKTCRKLLRKGRRWFAHFKGHEFAELLDAAIGTGELAADFLRLLLEAGVPAHCVYDSIGESYQHTPLVTAAKQGRMDLIHQLVAAGADPYWASPTGTNALSEILPSRACQAYLEDSPGRVAVRQWLISQGLRIDPQCADSRRKLLWASSRPESWPDVPGLLELGVPLEACGWDAFMLDLACGRVDVRAVDGLEETALTHRDAWNRTPFLLAVTAGALDIAKALLARGDRIEATGHCGVSALHIAADHGHCGVLEWLLQAGLLLDGRDDFGQTALSRAVGSNQVAAAALLLRRGADIGERDQNGYALIHAVPMHDDLAMLRLLIEAGADVDDVSGGGSWPLSDACGEGNVAAVALLLQAGADPNLTSTGQTALFNAVMADSLDCVRMLIEAGADVNATDCDGWTCLFHLRSAEIARFLLEQGASPAIADQCGGLPEDWPRIPLPVRQLLKTWRKSKSGR